MADDPDKGALYVQVSLGLSVAIVAYVGWRRVIAADKQAEAATRQADVARRSMTTTQFATAVQQLASDSLTERIGGLYTLERLAHDDPRSSEVATTTQLLSAFVRTRAPGDPSVTAAVPMHPHDPKAKFPDMPTVPPDIQVALTILGRLPEGASKHIDLSDAQLSGAKLNEACLRMARLDRADFTGADLFHADLTDARLNRARFAGAMMNTANLSGARAFTADFTEARMNRVAFSRTTELGKALFDRAVLKRVDWRPLADMPDLSGARSLVESDLRGVDITRSNLQDTDISRVEFDRQTRWPDGIIPPGPNE